MQSYKVECEVRRKSLALKACRVRSCKKRKTATWPREVQKAEA